METYWKDYQGDDESFWEHEWGKHGTCVSTLEPDCYTDYQPTEEAAVYFQKVVEVFKGLPTYKWLADAGITPSESEEYALSDVQAALEKGHGGGVTINCQSGSINEVWYHYNVQGSLQSGEFVPADVVGSSGDCSSQVGYTPKTGGRK
jgi:ribonuclease T2